MAVGRASSEPRHLRRAYLRNHRRSSRPRRCSSRLDWPLLREFMADPGQFRQLSIGDLLDSAFRLYRRRCAFRVCDRRAAVTACISTLLYFNLRIRREGYDLEILARQAESPASSINSTSNQL